MENNKKNDLYTLSDGVFCLIYSVPWDTLIKSATSCAPGTWAVIGTCSRYNRIRKMFLFKHFHYIQSRKNKTLQFQVQL